MSHTVTPTRSKSELAKVRSHVRALHEYADALMALTEGTDPEALGYGDLWTTDQAMSDCLGNLSGTTALLSDALGVEW